VGPVTRPVFILVWQLAYYSADASDDVEVGMWADARVNNSYGDADIQRKLRRTIVMDYSVSVGERHGVNFNPLQ
jgi:hypothetical protein